MFEAQMVEAMAFYVFSAITIFSGFMVISSKNAVHSVLYLILAFFNAAALFVLLGAEFLAMTLVIVYVGAVAVLFLFVVMMLDIDFEKMRDGFFEYLPYGGLIGFILLAEIIFVLTSNAFSPDVAGVAASVPTPPLDQVSNTVALGRLIYTDYIYVFQASGMILFVAMIGAIVLTHRTRKGVKKQDITKQVSRTASEAIEIKHVEPGKGI